MLSLLAVALLAPSDALPQHAVRRLGGDRFHLGNTDGGRLSPDGRTWVAGGRSGIRLIDVASGRPTGRLPGHGPLGYSPSGRRLAVLEYDGRPSLVVLDADTGRQITRGTSPATMFEFIAFADEDTLVVVPHDAPEWHVWDFRTGTKVRSVPRRLGYFPRPIALSPDGQTLALVHRPKESGVKDTLSLVEVGTGRERQTAELPPGATALYYTPDGRSLVTTGDKVRRYDAATGRQLDAWEVPGGWEHVCWPVWVDDRLYVIRREETRLIAYDLVASRLADFPLPGPVWVPGRRRPDSWFVQPLWNRLEVWDWQTGKPLHPTAGATTPIRHVALLADGSAVTAEMTTVRRWDKTGQQTDTWTCRTEYGAYATALTPDGRVFAAGYHGFGVWDTTTGRRRATGEGSFGVFSSPALSPDGRFLVYPSSPAGLQAWDATSGAPLWQQSVGQPEHTAAFFSPDGRRLFAADTKSGFNGGDRGAIREYDPADGKLRRTLAGHPKFMDKPDEMALMRWGMVSRPGHMGRVMAMVVTPVGRRLVSTDGGTLRVWELVTGQECCLLDRVQGYSPNGDRDRNLLPMAVSPDGSVLATPGLAGDRWPVIDLWNLRDGKRFASLSGHARAVTALAFSPDGRHLLSGGMDARGYVWAVPARPQPPAGALAWGGLADPDAIVGHQAVAACLADPKVIDEFRRLGPSADRPDPAQVAKLIADLDDDRTAVREAASQALRGLGPAVAGPLRAATGLSPEAARRVAAVLDGFRGDDLRAVRAVEVLEALGTPAARTLLGEWAKGDPASVWTREASAALARLATR